MKDVEQLMLESWVAGMQASAEGFNGEHHFAGAAPEKIAEECRETIAADLLRIIAWAPTHRHADGGQYRFLGEIAVKRGDGDDWAIMVKYDGADGRERATSQERWAARFTAISEGEIHD